MNFAVDVDGTIDSFPRVFQSLCSALEASGHRVYIVTGVSADAVTQDDIDAKRQYLASLGITMYSELIVCPTPHAENKAQVLEENDIAVLFDNDKQNIKAAAANGVAAFLLWNSKQ